MMLTAKPGKHKIVMGIAGGATESMDRLEALPTWG